MRQTPRRLRRRPERPVIPQDDLDPATSDWLFRRRHQRVLLGSVRAIRRAACIVVWTLPSMLLQAGFLVLPGKAKVRFAALYWAGVCLLLGMRVRVIGARATAAPGRQIVYVSNHSSWIDIPVLGAQLHGCFISKSEVAGWPVIGLVAKLGRTVFISRRPGATGRERDGMRERLDNGDDLILFPEGTTSDGSRVMPFRTAFFAVAEGEAPPLIQPVSIVYDRLAGLPTGRSCRPLFAWYGDMDIASHYWRLARHRGMRASVLLHTPIDPASYANRKLLAQAVWRVVADGAATLRQNRPAQPLGTGATPPGQHGGAPATGQGTGHAPGLAPGHAAFA